MQRERLDIEDSGKKKQLEEYQTISKTWEDHEKDGRWDVRRQI